MRNFIFASMAGSALVVAGCSITGTVTVDAPAPLTPGVPAVAPYECVQTKGHVRVVLVKVEHATVFTSDGVQDAKPGKVYPVPTIGITYRIEALGNEPIKTWNVTSDEITIGNHLIGSETLPANVTPGASSSVGPADADPRRSSLQRTFIRCGSVPRGAATLTLKAGFNDETHTFVFENVPLN